jgi:PadR family transcriptional regulator, regulatory protein PadR
MGQAPPDPLVPGTLEMLILQTLRHGDPMHGYAIANFIQQRSTEVLKVDEGALYPALHRLEVRGLLRSKWGLSENNRRAKFYSLTAAGRRELEHEATALAKSLRRDRTRDENVVEVQGMTAFLVDTHPRDPATLLGVSALLCAVGLIACVVPARRAAGLDPLVALRCE